MLLTLLRIELHKIFSKPRSYVAFIAIAVMVPTLEAAMYVEGESFFELATQTLREQFEFSGNYVNVFLIGYLVLQTLYVHIPTLITLVAGDALAGETAAGTFRLLLIRPIKRSDVVLAKWLATVVYIALVLLALSVTSLAIGYAVFGTGDFILLKNGITILSEHDIFWRFLCGYGLAFLSMITIASLAILLSCFMENSLAPIAVTMGIVIVFGVVGSLDVEVVRLLKPFWFTSYTAGWRLFFDEPVVWSKVWQACIVLSLYLIGFLSATIYFFKRKDILS